jgi:phospholipase/carboxylesterase
MTTEIRLGGARTLAIGPEDAPAIIVLCHGFAMKPEDLAPFCGSIGLPARWLLPEAPVPAALVPGTIVGRSWWHIDPSKRLDALSNGARDFATMEPPDLARARELLGRIVDDSFVQASGRRILLAGFSSGGMLAFDFMLRERRPVAGLALLSATRIAWREQQSFVQSRPLDGLPVLATHGTDDDDLAFSAGEALRDAAIAAGADVTWAPFEGGHNIPLIGWNRLRKWAKPLLAAPTSRGAPAP